MIVLARLINIYVPSTIEFEKRDRNWYPKLIEQAEARACIFCRKEKPGDLERAHSFAKQENYQVFLFPNSERKPLEKAKEAIIKKELKTK